jgi:radical SAM protein with 4Fe4S-binding SPASM domain
MKGKDGNKLIFSIEGGNRFSHEFITRVMQSWDCTIDSITHSVMAGIFTEIHTCPMTTNMYELDNIYNLLCGLGVNRWSLLRLVPQGRCSRVKYLITDKHEFKEMLGIIERIYEYMLDKQSRNEFATDIRIGDPLNFYGTMAGEGKEPIMQMTTCSAAKNRILIRANGETQFCAALKHSPEYDYGNLRETDLVDLWVDSEMANKLREFHEGGYRKIEGRCQICPHLDICRGGCLSQRIATYGDMYRGPDPLCPNK